ncbi:MAG TPA: FAD-dependent oxidoreductase [Longimicrobiales bacterium]|nr:FAD-dependent oxidoreductase [Longimicrobiales bacterium]
MGIDRRDFLKVAGAGAGLALGGVSPVGAEASPRRAPFVRSGQVPDIVVVGAGAFGAWTALELQRMGARVTLVDQYGPANSRATSGGETRGVRTSYGDRPHGLQWGRWAVRAIERWKTWDAEHASDLLPQLFFTTGDLILREEMQPFLEQTMANWDEMGHEYEVLTPDEVRYRWPAVELPDIDVALYEPAAGVVRARRAIESVARVFEQEGGTIRIGRVAMGDVDGRRVLDVRVGDNDRLAGGTFVFALGPWFPKFFPDLMGRRLSARVLGHVYYVATPPGDESYRVPNLPSYNVPGVTGWPALPDDARGFRIRTGGHRDDDPDTSVRWIDAEYHARPREVLAKYFPALAERPFNETRACHYESSVDSNFIIDHHRDYDNAWLAGGGSAEAFKQGPVLGEYIAGRVLGAETDPELTESFRLKEEEFEEDDRRGR